MVIFVLLLIFKDYNECKINHSVCFTDGYCLNSQFGFDCVCQNNFIGNGKVCSIDNTCNSFNCPENKHCVFLMSKPLCL